MIKARHVGDDNLAGSHRSPLPFDSVWEKHFLFLGLSRFDALGLGFDPRKSAAPVDILVAEDDPKAPLEVSRYPTVTMRRMVDMDPSDELEVAFSPDFPSRFMALPVLPPVIPGPVDAHHPAKQVHAVFLRQNHYYFVFFLLIGTYSLLEPAPFTM